MKKLNEVASLLVFIGTVVLAFGSFYVLSKWQDDLKVEQIQPSVYESDEVRSDTLVQGEILHFNESFNTMQTWGSV